MNSHWFVGEKDPSSLWKKSSGWGNRLKIRWTQSIWHLCCILYPYIQVSITLTYFV